MDNHKTNDARRRRPTASKRPKKKSGTHWGRIVLGFVIVALVMLTGIGCGFLTASINTKPDLEGGMQPSASSQIYDVNGNEIANIHATENRVPVKISQIPKNLQNAFIAVEDARFYEHSGIDPRGILRAIVANISNQGIAEGGSTITQQLAKNAYLTQERTLRRKVQEMFLALQLEKQYTKQEILEMYLNQIYFGQGAYGVEAAAKTYFGKDVKDLDLNECAMLAGIPKSPNYYSPFNNIEAAQERKATVLDQMVKYHYISDSEAMKLKKADIHLVKPQATSNVETASYFIEYVTQLLIDKYGADAVYKNGLKIYTSIDMDMQKAAEAARERQLYRFRGSEIKFNSQISPGQISVYCRSGEKGEQLLRAFCREHSVSARGYHRVLKTARTIADLADSEDIREEHLLEAVSYRCGVEDLEIKGEP